MTTRHESMAQERRNERKAEEKQTDVADGGLRKSLPIFGQASLLFAEVATLVGPTAQ